MDEIVGVEWRVSPGRTPYEDALAAMERRAAAIRAGEEREQEHHLLYARDLIAIEIK